MAASEGALSICGLQLACVPCDREHNLAHHADLVRQNPGHQLYLFPELSTCGYDDAVFERLEEFAEDVRSGPSAAFFGELAKEVGAHICYGIVRRVTDDEARSAQPDSSPFRICQVVVRSDGAVQCNYDKLHLCHYGDCAEKSYFSRGDQVCTFEVCGVTLGLLICYDIRFPELCRQLSWGPTGAQVLLHPAAFVRDTAFHSWHAFATTRALENQVYFFSLSFAGERWGNSISVPPWIDESRGPKWSPEILGQDEAVLVLKLDPSEVGGAASIADQVKREFSFRNDAVFPLPTKLRLAKSGQPACKTRQGSLLRECRGATVAVKDDRRDFGVLASEDARCHFHRLLQWRHGIHLKERSLAWPPPMSEPLRGQTQCCWCRSPFGCDVVRR